MQPFSLPDDITCKKTLIQGRTAYVFRHSTMGELGRIVLTGTPNGNTHIACEAAGNQDDPMTAKRQSILEPIARNITQILASQLGRGQPTDNVTPVRPQSIVRSQLIPCDKCGKNAVFLIHTDKEKITEGDVSDYERKMYQHIQSNNLATWVVSPMSGRNNQMYVQKVWPKRGEFKLSSERDFEKKLDKVFQTHC